MISYAVSPTVTTPDSDTVSKKNGLNHNNNSVKQASLKRVSFGSSKGSMVETLIYDHPLPEEETSYYRANITRFGNSGAVAGGTGGGLLLSSTSSSRSQKPRRIIEQQPKKLCQQHQLRIESDEPRLESHGDGQSQSQIQSRLPPAKVRVTFFDSEKPHYVSSPDSGDSSALLDFYVPAMSSPSPNSLQQQERPGSGNYNRQESTDSGMDNPFRPDGDLSREADQIVEMIKGGKPIASLTPTPELPDDDEDDGRDGVRDKLDGSPLTEMPITPVRAEPNVLLENSASPPKRAAADNKGSAATPGANGRVTTPTSPGAVEVQHSVIVPPSDGTQVEHVVLKKKPKCKCCVIM